jgi:signal transduction histidine kinase
MGAVDNSIEQEVGLLFGAVVVMLLLALALVAFFLLYQKKLVSQQLSLQTIQGAYQKEVFAAAIEAEERERERIGNDLHDEIGSSLSAAKLLMAQLEDSTSATEKEKEVIVLIKGILGNSLQDIRNISQNLHPAVLARFGLSKALHNLGLVCTNAFANGVAVQVELAAALPYAHELALYRIVQELINNALKHARASHVTVRLLPSAHGLVLTVADDGCGFDYARVRESNQGGLGLKSLAARVSLLNASMHVESVASQGTSVRIEVPLLG